MVLDAKQINDTISELKNVLEEQKRILSETDKVMLVELPAVWDCKAQRAYYDCYNDIKIRLLSQINALIELFGMALQESMDGMRQVDVDIASMNARAIQ